MSPSRRSRSAPHARRPGILVSTALFVVVASTLASSAVARDATATAPPAAGLPAEWAALAEPLPPGVVPPHNRVVVRRNVYGTGTAVDSQIDAYRRAVVAMKARPDTQKTSWMFQANMHGSYDTTNPNFNLCQHASYFFLSWHRMYLYYFERIARRASGDSNFALPYWNYTDSARWAYVPPQWRTPNDNTNPLWAPRVLQLNDGSQPLAPAAIGYMTAMSRNYFWVPSNMRPDTSFGGGRAPAQQFSGFTGSLEFTPHNAVHSAIRGLMANPRTAAQDPIFWIHHANIDRLWQQWRNRPAHPDPTDSAWLAHRFTFFDEDGAAVHLTGAQIVNTADSLGYRYDPIPAARPRARTLRQDRERRPLEVATAATLRGYDSVWVDREPFELTGERKTVVMTEVPGRRLRVAAARDIAVSLEGLTVKENPGLMYDILIKPQGVERDTVYVGTLEFFDLVGMAGGGHDAHMMSGGLTVVGRVSSLPPAFARSAKVDVIIEPVSLVEGLRPGAQAVPTTRVRAVKLSIR